MYQALPLHRPLLTFETVSSESLAWQIDQCNIVSYVLLALCGNLLYYKHSTIYARGVRKIFDLGGGTVFNRTYRIDVAQTENL